MASASYLIIVLRSVMYFLGVFFYIRAMVLDLETSLVDLDNSRVKSARQALANEIQFHTEMLEYNILTYSWVLRLILLCAAENWFIACSFISTGSFASAFSDNMSEAIFYQMLFSAIQLASFIFLVSITPANFTIVLGSMTVLLPTYLFCKLSENMADRLHLIENAFYGYSWYRLSVSEQKLFLLPIQRAQQKFQMNGLGIVDCSLQIFSKVNWAPAILFELWSFGIIIFLCFLNISCSFKYFSGVFEIFFVFFKIFFVFFSHFLH